MDEQSGEPEEEEEVMDEGIGESEMEELVPEWNWCSRGTHRGMCSTTFSLVFTVLTKHTS